MDNIQLYIKLADIESQIKEIVGHDIENVDIGILTIEVRSRIKRLLETRRQILNDMFLATDENMRRFRTVNDRLFTLTNQLHERFRALEEKLPIVMYCADFDADFDADFESSVLFVMSTTMRNRC